MNLKHPSAEMRGQTEAEFLANAPILGTLQARLEACRTPREWAVAKAQQALYLVRTDRIDETVPVPQEIRAQFRGHEEPEVYYWLWLLEAVLDFYRTGATKGMQKIQRAMLMAKSLKRTDLEEYLAAWAAHFCFTDGQYGEMVRWLKLSGLHEATLPEAACRASLVIAVAWQTCGSDKPAIHWFGRAREIARKLGDRATIMASITNRGAIRLNDLWLDHFFDRRNNEHIVEVANELLGGLGYERVTATASLLPQAHIFRMRLAYLQSDVVLACEELSMVKSSVGLDSYSILKSIDIFELWIRFVRFREIAITDLKFDKYELSIRQMDADDAAVCWKMLSEVASIVGLISLADEYMALSLASFNSYETERASLKELLVELA